MKAVAAFARKNNRTVRLMDIQLSHYLFRFDRAFCCLNECCLYCIVEKLFW